VRGQQPFQDSPAHRAAHFQRTDQALIASVEEMRRRVSVARTREELVNDIKATMHVPLPPHNFTVIQTLFEAERAKVFNQFAAQEFTLLRRSFGEAIQDFLITRRGKTPARTARKIAANAWKWDAAADRRTRKKARQGGASLYKGRPEIYNADVVWAFADAIARAAVSEHFSIGHHGDAAITEENTGGGAMFRVLVAAVRWALTAAWLGAGPPGTPPPTVKPEGILTVIKRGR